METPPLGHCFNSATNPYEVMNRGKFCNFLLSKIKDKVSGNCEVENAINC